MSLQANPDAMLFLRLHFALLPFWDQAHEDELVRISTSEGTFVYEEESTTRVGSLASEVWRRDQGQALRELIQHCKQQPWADRLAGFWVNGETTEEWFAYGSNDGLYGDYSQPNQQGFARWLTEKKMDVTPSAAMLIPAPDMRKHPGSDLYPPDEHGRRTAAYPQDVEKLRATIERGGKTIVVVGAPGFVDPAKGAYCAKRPAEVLGLPIRVDDAALPGDMALCSDGSPISAPGITVRPRASCENEGFLRYSDGPCAGFERPLPREGRLIWCGMPPLSAPLLRRWMEEAGVHTYAPPECFVYASRELVSTTSPTAGNLHLRWPQNVLIEDLFDGWRAQGSAMDCPFKPGQTRLFRVKCCPS
jgi:hypothetical protein